MLAIVGCLAMALACQDVDRTLGPRKGPIKDETPADPPVLLALTCSFDLQGAAISCAPTTPPASARKVGASVIYGFPGGPSYATFFAYNLVKDTIAHQWSFTAYLQNLLQQSIGTLNGTTVTGVKVVVTDFHATAGTGAVSVANADGTGTFTAPNQSYFNYNQIVAANAYTGNRLWKFNVPNTVTAVSMSIVVSTDFPAEQNVTLAPPDTTAKWVEADTNTGGQSAPTSINVPYSKRVLQIVFTSTATLADRQLAVAAVNGFVVGGKRAADGISGWYVVQVPDDGTGSGVKAARTKLRTLPQVQSAFVMVHMTGAELTPNDGTGFSQWSLSPDSVSHSAAEYNWSLEAIDAPYAWGCSTGNPQTKIGIVDYGFHTMPDLAPNLASSTSWVFTIPGDTSTDQHGTSTSSILLAQGNNGGAGAPAVNMTGAMWRGSLFAVNVKLGDSATHVIHNNDILLPRLGEGIVKLASLGVRAINISVGLTWKDTNHNLRAPGSFPDDTSYVRDGIGSLMVAIRVAQTNYNITALPLLVVASGNFAQPGANGTSDAWWNITPQLKDSLLNNVIVVGASTRTRTVANYSGANTTAHSLVDIMAPGDSIVFLSASSPASLGRNSGTSYAAPFVTAAAGLLVSFDSTLGVPAAGGAAQLRQLILDGADSNTTSSGTARKAGTYRFLSLYKPLVLAAKRVGAPLCRNHVWIADGQILAQRGSTTEVLGTTVGPHGWAANALHGGHRVQYSDSSAIRTLDYGIPKWVTGPTVNVHDSIPGGTFRSVFLHSHDGDTTVALSFADSVKNANGQPVQRVFISLTDTHGSPERDTTIDVPLGPMGQNEGGSPGCGTCFFPRLAGTYSVTGAFSSRGNRFLVAINRDTTSVTISTPSGCQSFRPNLCSGVGQNTAQYVYTPEKSSIYEIRILAQSPWFTDTLKTTLSGVWVYWAGVSETDLETVAGIGAERFTNYINDPRQNQPVVRVVTSCNIEYRNGLLATLSGGQSPIATNDACPPNSTNIGGGTVSPSIVRASTQVSGRRTTGGLLFHP